MPPANVGSGGVSPLIRIKDIIFELRCNQRHEPVCPA